MPATRVISSPTAVEPVKLILRTRGSTQRTPPSSAPEPVRHWIAFSGQPGIEQRSRQQQSRQRRLPRGLQNDGVAGSERRPDLVRHEQRREVERRDRDNDAAGLADGERQLARAVRRRVDRDGLAVHTRALGRARAQQRSDPGRLTARLDQRLADLGCDRAGELLDVGIEQIGGATEDLRALPGRELSHHARSLDGRRDGELGVVTLGDRHDADDLPVERAPDLFLAVPRLPLASDVHHARLASLGGAARRGSRLVVCGRRESWPQWLR